jgi:hypothetical protein
MRLALPSLLAAGLFALGSLVPHDAAACGGCFHETQGRISQVTGHRMIFSISNDQTSLWDQISYSGNPASFAWVLPIKGQVDVAVSSDALFAQLEQVTQVTILSPTIDCAGPPICGSGTSTSFAATTGTTGGGGVTVIAEETVGPYETVQLKSSDPAALQDWLASHGYQITPEVAPVVDAYVNDGFDFLALKLVPGAGVSSMQPVRVTAPGAGLGLPLRMVAAGTGETTPITLWVLGEGRYEPANFPTFTVDPADLVWNWDSQSSNYAQLKKLGFEASNGQGWLIESGETIQPFFIGDALLGLAEYDPAESGYGGANPLETCQADLDALYGKLDPSTLWLSRLHAELSKEALANDLMLGAAADQTPIQRTFNVTTTVGQAPKCPTYPPCNDTTSSSGGAGGQGGQGGQGGSNGAGAGGGLQDGGCAIGGSESPIAVLLAAAALAASVQRKRRRSR